VKPYQNHPLRLLQLLNRCVLHVPALVPPPGLLLHPLLAYPSHVTACVPCQSLPLMKLLLLLQLRALWLPLLLLKGPLPLKGVVVVGEVDGHPLPPPLLLVEVEPSPLLLPLFPSASASAPAPTSLVPSTHPG